MAIDMTLDELRARAARAGLSLNEEELKKLLPGIHRSHRQVTELRAIPSDAHEPAGIFCAAAGKTGAHR